MDYKACWDLQQELFDALVARKRAERDAGGSTVFPAGDSAEEHSATDDDPVGTVLLVEHPRSTRSARADMRRTCSSRARCSSGWVPASTTSTAAATSPSTVRGSWSAIRSSTRAARHRAARLHCRSRRGRHPHRRPPGYRGGPHRRRLGRLARQGSHSRRKGAGAEDLRNRSAIVTLCYHARLRAQRIDRPGVVLAHQPLRLHRPRGGVDPLGDGPKRPDGGGETFGCGTFK